RARPAGGGWSGADAAAGQVGRPGHPQGPAARATGYPVRPLAPRGGECGVDAHTLVWTVTGRTPDRSQERTVSADASGRLFDRLAGPEGWLSTRRPSPALTFWSPSAPV